MKKYKAKVSFAGIISMFSGEIKELDENDEVIKDLIKANYIEEVKEKIETSKKENKIDPKTKKTK